MLGGGFDAGHGHLAWRVAQFDWFLVHGSGNGHEERSCFDRIRAAFLSTR